MGVGRRSCVVLALVAGVVATASPAWAHGQVRPGRAAAGATIDTVLVVPSERDGHANNRIALALPPSFVPKSCRSPIGWRCTTADKGFSWERVTGLVEAEDFDLTMQVASTPGTYVLPLAQTYDDGETRTFTGGPGTRDEAPLFTVTGGTATSAAPAPSSTGASHPSTSATVAAVTMTPGATASATPTASGASASASPTAAGATAPASAAPDAGLGALPAGRRLAPPSSDNAPIALVAVGFVALTVLGGGVLFLRQRQAVAGGEESPGAAG